MKRFIRKHWLASTVIGISLFALGLMAIDGPATELINAAQVNAVATGGVPMDTVACKTAKSCKQRELQKAFAAQQKAQMKDFQAAQKARDKLVIKPKQKVIQRNPNLSKNEIKAQLKALAAEQKATDKAEMNQFKADQKAARTQSNAEIKAELKFFTG
jgi:hypothetical protein